MKDGLLVAAMLFAPAALDVVAPLAALFGALSVALVARRELRAAPSSA